MSEVREIAGTLVIHAPFQGLPPLHLNLLS